MVNSNARKLALSGWLKEHGKRAYDSPLKLQKYLLLYEALSKVDGEQADFSNLRGYKRGPVFSRVFGDYTYERKAFDTEADKAYRSNSIQIDEERAALSSFIVGVLSEKELSDLTHKMNLWSAKKTAL